MSRRKKYLTCSRKYDLPLFCAAWTAGVAPKPSSKVEGGRNVVEPSNDGPDGAGIGHLVFGGGGGDRKSGLMNNMVLASYDFAMDVLSEAIHTLSTDDDPPYRLAVHPGSNEIVCSVSKHCRIMELSSEEELKLKFSKREILPLQDVGEQNCLVFSTDGTRLATGGEDGQLRVFEWPSLGLVLDQARPHASIRDLDFSLDGSLLVSTGENGPCRVWDLLKASAIATLSSEKGGILGFCRFSRDGTKPFLFVTLMEAGKGVIAVWNTTNWKKVMSRKLSDEAISAFSISPDGRFLGIGTTEGDVSIVDAKNLVVLQRVKNAHMVFVTSMGFSPNSRALASVSGDSSARVTIISKPSKREGWQIYLLMLLLVLISIWFFLVRTGYEGGKEKSLEAIVNEVLSRVGIRQ